MNSNQISLKNVILAILVLLFIVLVSHLLLNIRTKSLINEKYTDVSDEIQFTTKSYIDAKKESILFIALSLANDPRYVNAIESSSNSDFKLDKFSENLQQKTEYKNVWIQISDSKGISLYRSWTKKRGDDLTKVRKDIIQMIQDPKIKLTISTGIFDMAFKAMVPIFKNEKFMGTIEVISKFNSIAIQILNNGFEPVVLVDKSYKDQIKKPFTKMFIDDYYVANLNASKSNQQYIKNYGIEKLIDDQDKYIIDHKNNKYITKYIQKDVNGKDMGYFILFYPLDNIQLGYIYFFHNAILVFIFLLMVGIYLMLQLVSSKHNKEKAELKNQLLSREVESKNIELEEQHAFLQNVSGD